MRGRNKTMTIDDDEITRIHSKRHNHPLQVLLTSGKKKKEKEEKSNGLHMKKIEIGRVSEGASNEPIAWSLGR